MVQAGEVHAYGVVTSCMRAFRPQTVGVGPYISSPDSLCFAPLYWKMLATARDLVVGGGRREAPRTDASRQPRSLDGKWLTSWAHFQMGVYLANSTRT